jgi:hypothetical protein
MSVSVYRNNDQLISSNNHPVGSLLLNSDLPSSIPNIDYFFENLTMTRKKELDREIMVYGWRTFEELLLPANPAYPVEINAPVISGSLTADESVQGKTLMAILAGKEPQLYTFQTDDENQFQFEVTPNAKTGDLLFWSDELDLNNYQLNLNAFFDQPDQEGADRFLQIDNRLLDFIQQYSVDVQIMNAYAVENKSRGDQIDEYELESPFYGSADASYILDNYTRFPKLNEVFKEYIRFADPRIRNEKQEMFVKDFEYNSVNPLIPALTLIDGVPVIDINTLWDLDQSLVEKIDVVSRKYSTVHKDLHGIVSVSTFKGNYGGNSVPDHVIQKLYDALQSPRKFYSPTYSENSDTRIPDFRNTLFWESDPTVDQDGKLELDFYTSDVEGEYMIEIFGHTINGDILFEQLEINVNGENNRP